MKSCIVQCQAKVGSTKGDIQFWSSNVLNQIAIMRQAMFSVHTKRRKHCRALARLICTDPRVTVP